jgi:CRP-like cAMP-binding protein
LLSAWPEDLLAQVLRLVTLHTFDEGSLVIKQGDPGTCLYWVVRGEFVIFRTDEKGVHHELSRVRTPSLFGEMSLIASEPRSASVVSSQSGGVLLALDQTALARLAEAAPSIPDTLDRFARERLLKNLLARSPLFEPFSPADKTALLRQFEGIEYEAGASIVRQGQKGEGLFVILSGRVSVRTETDAGQTPIAGLGAGDVFGEISMLYDTPTTAAVSAVTPTTVLFLPEAPFRALIAHQPQLAEYFRNLADRRAFAAAARRNDYESHLAAV